jgi:hypothetical protein
MKAFTVLRSFIMRGAELSIPMVTALVNEAPQLMHLGMLTFSPSVFCFL